MKDWLKDRPGFQLILSTLSAILVVLLTFWLTGWSDGKKGAFEEMKRLDQEKVSYNYFNNEAAEHQKLETKQDIEIEKKADKTTVESMDAKYETMRKEWREDQKEIRLDQKEILRLIGKMK